VGEDWWIIRSNDSGPQPFGHRTQPIYFVFDGAVQLAPQLTRGLWIERQGRYGELELSGEVGELTVSHPKITSPSVIAKRPPPRGRVGVAELRRGLVAKAPQARLESGQSCERLPLLESRQRVAQRR